MPREPHYWTDNPWFIAFVCSNFLWVFLLFEVAFPRPSQDDEFVAIGAFTLWVSIWGMVASRHDHRARSAYKELLRQYVEFERESSTRVEERST